MNDTTIVMCACGMCNLPLKTIGRTSRSKYLTGHSPHSHHKRRDPSYKTPLTQQGTKPDQCGKCGSPSIVADVVIGEEWMQAWKCLLCSWRGY